MNAMLMTALLALEVAARVGTTTISDSDIRCNPAEMRRTNRNATDEQLRDTCTQRQQSLIDAAVYPQLLAAAIRLYHISPSSADIAKHMPPDDTLTSIANFNAIQARALLAIMDGEPEASVQERLLRPAGVSNEVFKYTRTQFKDRDEVKRFLETDFMPKLRADFRAQARNEASLSLLRSYVSMRAKTEGVSFDEMLTRMSNEVEKEAGGVSVADRFIKPTLKGLLK